MYGIGIKTQNKNPTSKSTSAIVKANLKQVQTDLDIFTFDICHEKEERFINERDFWIFRHPFETAQRKYNQEYQAAIQDQKHWDTVF